MGKRLAVLQVTPESPNEKHVSLFSDKEAADFYFVTHDAENKDALKYCPNTTWVETRNILADLVPKEYDYYAFVDYDYVLRPQRDLGALEQILADLEEYEPAVLTYYPGNGLITPFATDTEYYGSFEYSVIPFTHCGLKIVHKSLMNWFFPMLTKFGGGVDACHMFNVQEIPLLKNVVCSHKMLYDNGVTDLETPHNVDGAYSKYLMDEMWKWVQPSFKKMGLINAYATNEQQKLDSLFLKEVFVDVFKRKIIPPGKSERGVDYMNSAALEKVFDLSHEAFRNTHQPIHIQMNTSIEDEVNQVVSKVVGEISYKDMLTESDPWPRIASRINSELPVGTKQVTIQECVDAYYSRQNNKSLFINTKNFDPDLAELLTDKRVAYVGPAPYLMGQNKGAEIDDYDVVVRIQAPIFSAVDYGKKTDIIQSCLNINYGPPLGTYLAQLAPEDRPKFIMCNDTVSHQKPDGSWAYVTNEYERYLKEYGVPLSHLQNQDGTWDRWQLYWEVYARKHIESFGRGQYVVNSANFNSGYGAINVLLRYPIKELYITGIDFYNMGTFQTEEKKYNPEYVKNYGKEGTPYGPDKILHDQLGQINHFKQVVIPNRNNLRLDEYLIGKLGEEDLVRRIDKYKKLPKFQHTTR